MSPYWHGPPCTWCGKDGEMYQAWDWDICADCFNELMTEEVPKVAKKKKKKGKGCK